jgi:hypothetical protein
LLGGHSDDPALAESLEVPVKGGQWDVRHSLVDLGHRHRNTRRKSKDHAHSDRVQDQIRAATSPGRPWVNVLIHDNENITSRDGSVNALAALAWDETNTEAV